MRHCPSFCLSRWSSFYRRVSVLIYSSSVTVEEFEHKYIHYSARLYRMALSLLDNRQDAEDVVHDVFLKLWFSISMLNNALWNCYFHFIMVNC